MGLYYFLYMVKNKKSNPIGIFDSGLGGLSILNEIHKCLPYENIFYLADSQNAPYGKKSQKEIIDLSIQNTEYLLSKSCKIIVVACNTATTNAIQHLRENFDVPFIGIEPAIKPAAIQSKTGQIGILATKGTLTSRLFFEHAKKFSQNTKIIEVIGKGIVEAIENNTIESQEFDKHLTQQLQPFLSADIDHLVLGCSHYPFIISKLKKILDPKIDIIDSGFAVARQTKRVLKNNDLENNINTSIKSATIKIFTNGTSMPALDNILDQLKLIDYTIINS